MTDAAKAARAVARHYGSNGTRLSDAISDAFGRFADLLEQSGSPAYRCGACNTADPLRHQRCDHPGCPDGR